MSDLTYNPLTTAKMQLPLNQKIIKRSNKRLILCGNEIEIFEYEKPFFYNFAPSLRSGGNGSSAPKDVPLDGEQFREEKKRRDDHLKRTRSQLRRLITSNATAWNCTPIFVTYTFAENITKIQEANYLFGIYTKRLNRRLGRKVKYLTVPEFQKRGAVHYHTIYFDIPYIEGLKKILRETWGYGFIDLKTIRKIKNIGAYVSKYLRKDTADIRLTRQKGYFCSKGLKQPYEIKNQEFIDSYMKNAIIEEIASIKYRSERYGEINYKQYKIK